MKKMVTLLSLLSAPVVFAQVDLDVFLKVNDTECVKQVSFDENNHAIITENTLTCDIELLTQDDKEVTFQATIVTKNAEGKDELIAQPTVVTTWDQKATITVEETNPTNALTLTLTPSKK